MELQQFWFFRRVVAPCLAALGGRAATLPATVPTVALLIDGENCPSTLAAAALAEAAKHGPVHVRRVYANWAVASQRWIEPVARYNIRPVYQQPTVAGKNAIDIALVVDAMDLLHAGVISCFCLVASDSDYTPLVTRLCAAGRTVVVLGRVNTPQALVQACSLFVPLEQPASPEPPTQAPALAPMPAPLAAKQVPAAVPVLAQQSLPSAPDQNPAQAPDDIAVLAPVITKPLTAAQRRRLRHLLRQAWEAAPKMEDGWLYIGTLGQQLKQSDQTFDPKTYGYARLGLLVQDHTDLFRLRQRNQGQYDVQLIV